MSEKLQGFVVDLNIRYVLTFAILTLRLALVVCIGPALARRVSV